MNVFKKLKSYLIRPELDVRHKIINISVFSAMIAQLLMLGVTASCVSDILGVYVGIISLCATALCFYLLNSFPGVQAFLMIYCCMSNYVVLPILYFSCGGYRGGTLIWMLMSAVATVLVSDGRYVWPLFAVNVLLDSSFVVIQHFIPNCVIPMVSPMGETMDLVMSVLFMMIILAVLMRFQTLLYEEQQRETKARDAQLVEANLTLSRTDKAKSAFLVKLSHEIRTPINSIVGMNTMILRESREDNIISYASGIGNASQGLVTLVNDILDMSRIVDGEFAIAEDEYDFFDVLLMSYNTIAPKALEKNIKLTFENDPDIPSRLCGDSVRIRQCIDKLLSNAVKYTSHGTVVLSASVRQNADDSVMLHVAVTDTGTGISPSDLDTIYDTFRDPGSHSAAAVSGIGLGLPITKRLVDLMGGTLEIKSTKGFGSTFTLEIPQKIVDVTPMGSFAERDKEYVPGAEQFEKIFTAPDAAVLVVDDVRLNLNVAKALMKRLLISPDVAENGNEALSMLAGRHYDVVFLDHMMPGIEGIEVLHRLRASRSSASCDSPIVVLTANALPGSRDFYLQQGFDDYLSKPLKASELERLLLKYIPEEKISNSNKPVTTYEPAPHIKESDPKRSSSRESWLKSNFAFLDVSSAIGNCGDSADVLIEVLDEMTKQNVTENLADSYKAEDWNNYAIFAHSMKGTLRVIGCRKTAEKAFELEQASKAGDADKVCSLHDDFMKEYTLLREKIRDILQNKPA